LAILGVDIGAKDVGAVEYLFFPALAQGWVEKFVFDNTVVGKQLSHGALPVRV
jgi:hypothetical protein